MAADGSARALTPRSPSARRLPSRRSYRSSTWTLTRRFVEVKLSAAAGRATIEVTADGSTQDGQRVGDAFAERAAEGFWLRIPGRGADRVGGRTR
jgi:hypothetical protein